MGQPNVLDTDLARTLTKISRRVISCAKSPAAASFVWVRRLPRNSSSESDKILVGEGIFMARAFITIGTGVCGAVEI
jgi:hypothetical protein